ncbi:MAG: MetS family NSS transporter small subunit [Candidatus Thermoplasmatota archaeon]
MMLVFGSLVIYGGLIYCIYRALQSYKRTK